MTLTWNRINILAIAAHSKFINLELYGITDKHNTESWSISKLIHCLKDGVDQCRHNLQEERNFSGTWRLSMEQSCSAARRFIFCHTVNHTSNYDMLNTENISLTCTRNHTTSHALLGKSMAHRTQHWLVVLVGINYLCNTCFMVSCTCFWGQFFCVICGYCDSAILLQV